MNGKQLLLNWALWHLDIEDPKPRLKKPFYLSGEKRYVSSEDEIKQATGGYDTIAAEFINNWQLGLPFIQRNFLAYRYLTKNKNEVRDLPVVIQKLKKKLNEVLKKIFI